MKDEADRGTEVVLRIFASKQLLILNYRRLIKVSKLSDSSRFD